MLQAALWGAFAGSSILLGALLGIYKEIPRRILGWIMSFGTGVLIGAASFELLRESVDDGGLMTASAGFIIGSLTFTISELLITKKAAVTASDQTKTPKIILESRFLSALSLMPYLSPSSSESACFRKMPSVS